MITKEKAKDLQSKLKSDKGFMLSIFEGIHKDFKEFLKENGEFTPTDYELTYSGCDFPITCKVEKVYVEGGNIMCTLHDVEYEDNETGIFDVPITDLEPLSLYGDHILNLYGQAIEYFKED